MGFKIERANSKSVYQPEGNYMRLDGTEWLIENITISASGRICLHIYDPRGKSRTVHTVCTLEELVLTVEGADYVQH